MQIYKGILQFSKLTHLHSGGSVSAPLTHLSLVDGDPVCRGEPLVALDVVDAVLQVAVAFCQVHLQQVSEQILQVGAEVRRESHLRAGGRANT